MLDTSPSKDSGLPWYDSWLVVIPSLNEGQEVIDTVYSVLSDAEEYHGQVKILVSDDCSTDYSGLDCKLEFADHEAVRVLKTPKRLGITRNKTWAYEQAARIWGDSFGVSMFIDAHTTLTQNFFRYCAEGMAFHGDGAVYTPCVIPRGYPDDPDQQGVPYTGAKFVHEATWDDAGMIDPRPTIRPYPVMLSHGGCQIFPRRLYEGIGGFDSGLIGYRGWEDREVSVRTWLMGYEVRAIPRASVTILYRMSQPYGGQTWRTHLYDLARITFGLLDRHHAEKVILLHKDHKEFREAIYDILLDTKVVEELNERRKRFVMTSEDLFRLFDVWW